MKREKSTTRQSGNCCRPGARNSTICRSRANRVASHHSDEHFESDAGDFGDVFLRPHETAHVDAENADDVAHGLRNPAFAKFQQFNEGVRRALEKLDADLE